MHKGPGATDHFEGGGFIRSNEDVKYPNIMFHFYQLLFVTMALLY